MLQGQVMALVAEICKKDAENQKLRDERKHLLSCFEELVGGVRQFEQDSTDHLNSQLRTMIQSIQKAYGSCRRKIATQQAEIELQQTEIAEMRGEIVMLQEALLKPKVQAHPKQLDVSCDQPDCELTKPGYV